MQRLGPTKKRKSKCSECVECFGHWTVFMCWTESGLCTRVMGDCRADPQRSQFHPTNLFLSLNLWCKDLVPKKGKGEEVSVWLFWPRDCLSMLNRKRTFTRDGCLKKLTQQGVVSPKNLFLSLNLWRKDLVPQKKRKRKSSECVIFLVTGLSLCAEQRVGFVQEMGDWNLTSKGVAYKYIPSIT